MASTNFDTFIKDLELGAWNFSTGSFKATLHTNTFVPNKQTMTRYTDATVLANELPNGNGYTTGGLPITPTLIHGFLLATPTDVETINWSSPQWSGLTATAVRYLVIREATTGDLIAVVDGGSPGVNPSNGTLTFNVNTGIAITEL